MGTYAAGTAAPAFQPRRREGGVVTDGNADFRLFRVTLTERGRRVVRDVQAAHGLVRELTRDDRAQWVQPRPDVLYVRAARVRPNRAYAAEAVELPEHLPGSRVEWAVIAHPVSRHGSAETTLTGRAAEQWIRDRLRPAIDIDSLSMERVPSRRGIRWGKKLCLTATAFTGTGTITDLDAYVKLYRDGVGRARAYGFGLLLARSIP